MSSRVEKLAFLNDRLARRRGFLEAVLQSIQEGVLVVSAEGAIVYANRTAEAMLGFESEHARGRPVERFLPDVDWAALASNGGGAWDGVSSLELEVFRPHSPLHMRERFLYPFVLDLKGFYRIYDENMISHSSMFYVINMLPYYILLFLL